VVLVNTQPYQVFPFPFRLFPMVPNAVPQAVPQKEGYNWLLPFPEINSSKKWDQ